MNEEKKLNMDKVKQVTLIAIALILLGVGFMNYEPNNSNGPIAIVENEDMIGDVQLVSSNAVVENENIVSSALVENEVTVLTETGAISVDNYFETTKLERDTMYSKMLESFRQFPEPVHYLALE